MTAPQPSPVRRVQVRARSTDVFGRVLCSARDHHFIVDGPVTNGCPGEELTPPELFLSAVASCGVELVHVIARDAGERVDRVAVSVHGTIDRSRQPREDVTVFTSVRVDFTLSGTDDAAAARLVEGFKRR
ncbi:MAG: OsmC family protein [Gemmatimonadaceae bacterium]